ncbi:hypothetical protein ATCC90586_001081 [Pythium insidiosum]|nr:hypothetical protein ATCC90586_001081 [Pythium insidiosum]
MRVLLVNAFPAQSRSGAVRFEAFRQHVRRLLRDLEREDVTSIEVIEKGRLELDEFLFEMHSTELAFASDPQAITRFDRLDFVLVAGDASACPWAPAMRKLTLLAKMCMMTGKCFFGSGLGAALVAFVCSTAGESLHVVHVQSKPDADGRGGLQALALPPPDPVVGHSASHATEVVLDARSGDLFAFDAAVQSWVPHGNTGLMLHSSDHAHDYGARPNTARAGTKRAADKTSALCLAKRGDTKCCVRLEASSHPVVQALGLTSREFLVNCKSTWDLDDRINATGENRYTVLADSSRGPMVVEFGNALGTHFALSKEYPESGRLLRSFVLTKHSQLRVHEHLDRSFVSAITGSARLRDRLQLAQTKALGAVRPASARPPHSEPSPPKTMATSGRTSPKRCRPVSAGPTRSAPKTSVRTIKTSRSVFPSPPVESDSFRRSPLKDRIRSSVPAFGAMASQNSNNNDAFEAPAISAHSSKSEDRPEDDQPSPPPEPAATGPPPETPLARRRAVVRVAQRNELERPYCALERFNRLREQERQLNKELYYSVVNDAPYLSSSDREVLEAQRSKLKWVAGPFRTAVGKATTQVVPQAGIFAHEPFDPKNTVHEMSQRRQLFASASPRRPTARPASAMPPNQSQSHSQSQSQTEMQAPGRRRPRPASSGPLRRWA